MKLCECGCGELTITVSVNSCKRNNGKYNCYLRIYEPNFILGHSKRKIKICKQCNIRIWKYCSKDQMFCSRDCQYKYQNETGYLPIGEDHGRWNGGNKATDARQWKKKKSNPIVLDKIHNRIREWYKINKNKVLAQHWLMYHTGIRISKLNNKVVDGATILTKIRREYGKAK